MGGGSGALLSSEDSVGFVLRKFCAQAEGGIGSNIDSFHKFCFSKLHNDGGILNMSHCLCLTFSSILFSPDNKQKEPFFN
jgi:hypothetical protein